MVIAEIVKADAERMIGLPPGTYTVKRRLPDRLRIGEVRVTEGAVTTLEEGALRDARFSDDPVKGTGIGSTYASHWSFSVNGTWMGVFDRPTTTGGYFPSAPSFGLDGTLHNFFGRGFGLALDASYGFTDAAVNTRLVADAKYHYSVIGLGVTGLYELNQAGRFIPFGGIRVGLDVMSRTFLDPLLPTQTYTIMVPGLVLGLKVRLSKSFSVLARGRVHYLLYNVDEKRSLGYAEASLLVDYEFRE